MASDRLRRALRAVPDDIKTRHALADAYQVRTFLSIRLNAHVKAVIVTVHELLNFECCAYSLLKLVTLRCYQPD
jgi:hypothetical protein